MMSSNTGEVVEEVIILSSDEEFSEPAKKQAHGNVVTSQSSVKPKSLLDTSNSVNLRKVKTEVSKCSVANGIEVSESNLNTGACGEGSFSKRKHSDSVEMKLPKKNCIRNADNSNSKSSKELFDEFVTFIRTEMLVSVEEEKKIVEKLESNFNTADPQYIKSISFHSLLSTTTRQIKDDKKNIFVYILDVARELKAHKMRKTTAVDGSVVEAPVAVGYFTCEPGPSTSNLKEPSVNTVVSNDSHHTAANEEKEKYIRKLEKLLRKIHEKIDKLQKRELSLDDLDDDDSYYMREDRLKKHFIKVWKLLCKKKQCSSKLDCHINKKFRYSGTKYPELNKRVEDLINKRNIFPDFSDIYNLVVSFSNETNLKFPLSQIERLAEDVFSDVGKELKHRRQLDDEDILHSYLFEESATSDPADNDIELNTRLKKSAEDGEDKMQQLIDEYVQKQYSLKLEPVEVPDNAESSSGDDNQEEEEEEEEENNDALNPEELPDTSGSSENEFIITVPDSEKLAAGVMEQNNLRHELETPEELPVKITKKKCFEVDNKTTE